MSYQVIALFSFSSVNYEYRIPTSKLGPQRHARPVSSIFSFRSYENVGADTWTLKHVYIQKGGRGKNHRRTGVLRVRRARNPDGHCRPGALHSATAEINSKQSLSKTSKCNEFKRGNPDCTHSFTHCQKTSVL